jgi:hypothetical protein
VSLDLCSSFPPKETDWSQKRVYTNEIEIASANLNLSARS